MFQYIFKLLFVFLLSPAFGETQYKPSTSPLNHSVSFGLAFEPVFSGKGQQLSSRKGGGFLNYYYFPPWDKWLTEQYRGYVLLGLGGGIKQFFYTPGLCPEGSNNSLLMAQGGVQLRGIYWEFFQPFAEMGLGQSYCHKTLKNISPISKKLRSYFSLGFALSLKVLDQASIYSLDEDYGLNDLSLVSQCLRINNPNKSKGIFICQIGLEALF